MKRRILYLLTSGLLTLTLHNVHSSAKGMDQSQKEKKINPFFACQDTIIRSMEKLSAKDSLLLDSILRASRNAVKIKYVRFIAEGKIPIGFININYNNLLSYNLFEGFKIGIGAETNRHLSKYISAGGYLTYGLSDRGVRHGSWLNVYPNGYYNFRIFLGYRDSNMEYGEPEFLEKKSLLNPESYRSLLVKNMFSTKRYTAGVEVRPFPELNTYLFGDLSDNTSRPVNYFLSQHPFPSTRLVRIGMQLRYSPGLEFIKDPDLLIEKNIPRSDWFFTAMQGLDAMGSKDNYRKFEFKGRYMFHFITGSNTKIILRSGHISPDAPVFELFNGYGSYAGTLSLVAPFSFNTMRQNEFAATNYAALHLRHEFGYKIYPPGKKFRPIFIISQNMGVGQLNAFTRDKYRLNDFGKGYYETGFEINNLFKIDFLGWGAGIYYRYGPYHLPTTADNFAYKFGFLINL